MTKFMYVYVAFVEQKLRYKVSCVHKQLLCLTGKKIEGKNCIKISFVNENLITILCGI